ncbi:MAG: ABC transporter permease [Planctomycetota bacterium]
MRKVIVLALKEFKTYFVTPIAYIYLAIFLSVPSWIYFSALFEIREASLRYYFNLILWVLVFFIPAVSMRLWSEEKRTGTIEVLLTLPLSNIEVVAGKFVAGMLFILVSIFATLPIPIIVNSLGELDWGIVFTSYLGFFLMGILFLSIGMFFSVTTRNQIVAYLVTMLVLFLLVIVNKDFILKQIPESLLPLKKFFILIGVTDRFETFLRGLVDTRDIFYFLGISFIFLLSNYLWIEGRKWI